MSRGRRSRCEYGWVVDEWEERTETAGRLGAADEAGHLGVGKDLADRSAGLEGPVPLRGKRPWVVRGRQVGVQVTCTDCIGEQQSRDEGTYSYVVVRGMYCVRDDGASGGFPLDRQQAACTSGAVCLLDCSSR